MTHQERCRSRGWLRGMSLPISLPLPQQHDVVEVVQRLQHQLPCLVGLEENNLYMMPFIDISSFT